MKIIEKKGREKESRKKITPEQNAKRLALFMSTSYIGYPQVQQNFNELVNTCLEFIHDRFSQYPPSLLHDMISALYELCTTTEYLLSKPLYQHLRDAEKIILGRTFEDEVKLAKQALKNGRTITTIRDDIMQMVREKM